MATARGGAFRSRLLRLLRLLDEHDSCGGAAKAAFFLVHPGPSLLVTAVVLAAAGLAERSVPGVGSLARVGLIVLPAQLAIGAANDLADVEADRAAKPHKPLVRGAVSARLAVAIVAAGSATCLASAASLGWTALTIAALGLAAGLAYDAGLKRQVSSWLTWWAGFAAVPLGGYAGVGRLSAPLGWVVLLTGLLSLSLHCANALPDLAADRAAGVGSLPVRLGADRATAVMLLTPVLAAAAIGGLAAPLHQGVIGPSIAAAVLIVTVFAARRRPRLAFVLLAVAVAMAAVTWLAALPGPP